MNVSGKTTSGGDFYLKGVHRCEALQEKILDYIEHFGLCPDCSNPRLKIKASKQKRENKLAYSCHACGNKGLLKARHRNAGKMFKFICNTLRTDKKKSRKRESSKPLDVDTSLWKEEKVEADLWKKTDFTNWVLSPPKPEHAIEPPPTEADLVPESTPQGLLRFVLNDPNKNLLERTSEFQRILTARRIEDELKIARIVTSSTLDFSSKETLLDTIQTHGVFLSWFCRDRERALMLVSLTSDGILNNGLLPFTAEILERMYDSQILTPELLLHWNELPAEQCYILEHPEDVRDIKLNAEPFLSWLKLILSK